MNIHIHAFRRLSVACLPGMFLEGVFFFVEIGILSLVCSEHPFSQLEYFF